MTTFDIINPATEEFIRSIELVDVEATDDAIAKAVVAQKRWAATAPAARAQVLRSFARIVAEHNEELAQIEVANAGHPIGQARWEAQNVANVLEYYAAAPERLIGEQIPVEGGVNVTFHEAVGVVGIITPWNFPMPIAAWGFAPALAAGCAVVLKPAEWTPLTAIRIAELALEAGLPEDLLTVLPGKGSVVGNRFVTHPDLSLIHI